MDANAGECFQIEKIFLARASIVCSFRSNRQSTNRVYYMVYNISREISEMELVGSITISRERLMVCQGYHDNTERNYVLNGGNMLGDFQRGNKKLADKAVNKNKVNTTKTNNKYVRQHYSRQGFVVLSLFVQRSQTDKALALFCFFIFFSQAERKN